jgi:hypothetical protein
LYCRWYCSTRARAPARILRPEFPNPGQTAIKQNKGKRKGRERERERAGVGRFQWKVKIFRISIITVRKSRVIVKLTRAGILFNL